MTGPLEPSRKVSPRIISALVLLVTFLVGAIGGIWLDRHHHHREMGHRSAWRERMPLWALSETEHRRRWSRVARILELTDEQRAAADTIFAQRSRQLDAARVEIEPKMKEIMGAARTQVDSLLTPAQRTKLQELRKTRGTRGKGERH